MFPWTIKWESRHCVSKDWDIARSWRNTQRRTGSWTLLSLSVNASMKRDQLSPENQAEVDADRFVRQRWSNKLVNWFVRKKTSQGQARAPERSLNNWTFIDHPFSELWNVTFNCLPFDVFQLRSSLNPSSRNVMNAVRNLSVACQWNSRRRSFLLMKKTFTWTLQLTIKMIVFGPLARSETSTKGAW